MVSGFWWIRLLNRDITRNRHLNLILTGIPPSELSGTGDFILYLYKFKSSVIAWKPDSLKSFIYYILKLLISRNLGNFIELLDSLFVYYIIFYLYKSDIRKHSKCRLSIYIFHPQSLFSY